MTLRLPDACEEELAHLKADYLQARALVLGQIQGWTHREPNAYTKLPTELFEHDLSAFAEKNDTIAFLMACCRWLTNRHLPCAELEKFIEALGSPTTNLLAPRYESLLARDRARLKPVYRLRETPYGEVWLCRRDGKKISVGFLLPPEELSGVPGRDASFVRRVTGLRRRGDADEPLVFVTQQSPGNRKARYGVPCFESTDIAIGSLDTHMHRLTPTTRLRCVARALDGLAYLHAGASSRSGPQRTDFFHDFVNPKSILLTARGPILGEPRLLDRQVDPDDRYGRIDGYDPPGPPDPPPNESRDLYCAALSVLHAWLGHLPPLPKRRDVLKRLTVFDAGLTDSLTKALKSDPNDRTTDLSEIRGGLTRTVGGTGLDKHAIDFGGFELRMVWVGTTDETNGRDAEGIGGGAFLIGTEVFDVERLPPHLMPADLDPSAGVSWNDATRICDALSRAAGFAPAYSQGATAGQEGFRLASAAALRHAAASSAIQRTAIEWTDADPDRAEDLGPFLSPNDPTKPAFERRTTRLAAFRFRLMLPPKTAHQAHRVRYEGSALDLR